VNSFYILLSSAFGTLGILWQETGTGPRIHRVVLPDERTPVEDLIQGSFAGASPGSCPPITQLGERVQSFLEGEALRFELDLVALESCSDFQRRVLLAEHQIPRGWVSTYGRIARHLGKPGGARAVGGALAHNPFPIIVPCHRAVRSDGQLGGFQGGQKMKRALLEFEGIAFSRTGRVLTDRMYY
jgi:methylated-DNA-[protein]-cysteine S-methyltransferase